MSFEPAVVSAVTALVAVIVGPLVSIFVAKNQINASVVSANRQTWINRLRDELATLVGIVHHLPSAHANETVSTDSAISEYGRFVEKFQVIKLLINPKEADHQELIRLIESADKKIIESIIKKQASASEFETAGKRIVDQSQIVLKREWERVKKGK
jgi:ABC-type oligopeptide transport system ATPase subunit